jgi:hypothetical protein
VVDVVLCDVARLDATGHDRPDLRVRNPLENFPLLRGLLLEAAEPLGGGRVIAAEGNGLSWFGVGRVAHGRLRRILMGMVMRRRVI